VWPLPLKFGAHIKNIEVENITDDVFDLVHSVLLKYKVVIIPNQESLTIEGQRRFTQRFGKLHVHLESSSHYPGYSDVNVVSNIKNENGSYIGLFGAHVENFHSDLSW
jgi:alpha-ketoglutarate-dependent taurine dioxygenase